MLQGARIEPEDRRQVGRKISGELDPKARKCESREI